MQNFEPMQRKQRLEDDQLSEKYSRKLSKKHAKQLRHNLRQLKLSEKWG